MVQTEEQEVKIKQRDVAIEAIATRLSIPFERGRKFAELTSLRVGGAIDWVLSPQTEEEAAALIHALEENSIPWRPLGSGSNVLADDGEHHYAIVSLKQLKANPIVEGDRLSTPHFPILAAPGCRIFAAAALC